VRVRLKPLDHEHPYISLPKYGVEASWNVATVRSFEHMEEQGKHCIDLAGVEAVPKATVELSLQEKEWTTERELAVLKDGVEAGGTPTPFVHRIAPEYAANLHKSRMPVCSWASVLHYV